MTTKRILLSVVLVAALGSAASVANAQSFPNRPIRLIVSFPPGGAVDVIARTVGTPLGQRLGQNVVIDNRPGSNGNISAELAANARPDGHTLLLGSDSLFGINPHLYSRMPVDLSKAFVPVANLVTNMIILAVNPDKVPSKTLGEFVAFARNANPPLFYASIGNGSQHHIAMELLKRTAKIDLTHVPYKGGGPAGIATVGGETVAMFGGGAVVPLVRSGKLRALAVSSTKRSPTLPELPTIAETYPGYSVTIWQGLFAPAGTPPEILTKLRTEVQEVLKMPDVAQKLLNAGSGEPSLISVEEFSAMIAEDYVRYGRVIKDTGIKVDN
ncbi:MAG TPA: tripartite tricarboxylate transporter substrate binding protein [Xanthobacteraceae bacterium]|nr:tripartite tricarboxylate transporter substrate binding protein [Xanthobacteraceae bacterium]